MDKQNYTRRVHDNIFPSFPVREHERVLIVVGKVPYSDLSMTDVNKRRQKLVSMTEYCTDSLHVGELLEAVQRKAE